MSDNYKSGSLSLTATVAMGTGVMIGAGIFALTGQVAEYAGGRYGCTGAVAAQYHRYRLVVLGVDHEGVFAIAHRTQRLVPVHRLDGDPAKAFFKARHVT